MSKYLFLFLISVAASRGLSQSVAGVNFRHVYDPQNQVELALRLVREPSQLTVYFRLLQNGVTASDSYTIAWSRYESYTSKEGTALSTDPAMVSGSFSYPIPEKPWLLVARVTGKSGGTWIYSQLMESRYPVDGYLEGDDGVVFKPYVVLNKEYTIHGSGSGKPIHMYYYRSEFPVASPPYTEQGAHVDRFMFADSTFMINPGQKISLRSKGLYLAQQDTSAVQGFAFMAMNPAFPKLTKIEDIPDPLIFVSAKEEHDELIAAGSDKSKVDKVILDITQDKDRAKTFMRSYFRKVELADLYFSSYKEGWKTDRGMMYLIFGLPDEVSRTGPNEVWYYKALKERFTFVKTGSIYDPNNFTLVRSSKYSELWYSTVDLWRKSRF